MKKLILFISITVLFLAFQNCGELDVEFETSSFELNSLRQDLSADMDGMEELHENLKLSGDMIVDTDNLEEPPEVGSFGMSGLPSTGYYRPRKWAGGIMPVKFASNISTKKKKFFMKQCKKWGELAKFKCVYRKNQEQYVFVTNKEGLGCYSDLGRVHKAIIPYNRMNLTNNCFKRSGVVAHEIGHALGLIHEHQRPDRNKYVEVRKENMKESDKGAYTKYKYSELPTDETKQTSYDFESIMHYEAYAGTKNNKRTMVPRPEYRHLRDDMGPMFVPGAGPTTKDKRVAARIYGYK